jgi:nucleotidyltransferase substrate binding protein (TIGR01987 family)
MDRLKHRLSVASRALATFEEILSRPKSDEVRDAAIKRFEYTFETIWKASQAYLQDRHGLEAQSPKAAIRASWQVGALDEAKARALFAMAGDRNLTVHTYNEKLADEIYGRLAGHAEVLSQWLAAISH